MRYTLQIMSFKFVTCFILNILLINDIRKTQKIFFSHSFFHDLNFFISIFQIFIFIFSFANIENKQHDMKKKLFRKQIVKFEIQIQKHNILQQHSNLKRQKNELQTHKNMIKNQYQRTLKNQQIQHANNTMRTLQKQKIQHEKNAMFFLKTQKRKTMIEIEFQKIEIAILKKQLRRNEMKKIQNKKFYTITSIQIFIDCINAIQFTIFFATFFVAIFFIVSFSKFDFYVYSFSHRRQHSIIEITIIFAIFVFRVEIHVEHSSQSKFVYASIEHYDTFEIFEIDNYKSNKNVHLFEIYDIKNFFSVTNRRHVIEIFKFSKRTSNVQSSKFYHQYRQQNVQRDYRQSNQFRDHSNSIDIFSFQRFVQFDSQNRRVSHDDNIDCYFQQQNCIKLIQKIVAQNKKIKRFKIMMRKNEQFLFQKQRNVLELMQRT